MSGQVETIPVYRDVEFFKLRIMAIHEAKYAFSG
jgi:hypothetical protein